MSRSAKDFDITALVKASLKEGADEALLESIDYEAIKKSIDEDYTNLIIAGKKDDYKSRAREDVTAEILKQYEIESFDDIKKFKESSSDDRVTALQTEIDKLTKSNTEYISKENDKKREDLLVGVRSDDKEFISYKIDSMVKDDVDAQKALETLAADEKYLKYFEKDAKILNLGGKTKKTGGKGNDGDLDVLDAFYKRNPHLKRK